MSEVNITINGRNFGISCEDGQEQRVLDLSNYVDTRLKNIAKAGAATNESKIWLRALTVSPAASKTHNLLEKLPINPT